MAVIAGMRDKPKGCYHRHHSNKHYANRGVSYKVNTTTDHYPPEADHCCGRSKGKAKKGYHRSNKYYLKHIVQVLLDRGYNSHLVFVTKDKPMLFPYSNRLVPQLRNTLSGIAQKHKLRGSWTSLTTLITKGSIQNLIWLSTTRLGQLG